MQGEGDARKPLRLMLVENQVAFLPPCPRPVGSYAPGKIHEELVFASGQTPTCDGTLLYKGRVGVDLSVEDAYAAARLAALNCLSELEAVCGYLRRVKDILKLNGYVAAADWSGEQNGASDLLGEVFVEAGVHARTSIGVYSLPGGAPVEIELVAALRDEEVAEEVS